MTGPPRRRRRWLKRLAVALLLVVGVPVALFVVNGTLLSWGETPRAGRFAGVEAAPASSPPGEVTVVAYNIAKGFAPRGGLAFHDETTVAARLDRMAEVIRTERPDVVVLSEAMTESGGCRLDQVEHLARACGLPYWAFGENYCFGLPGYRVVGGNAILSRTPVTPVANPSLVGRRPFFITRNSRRALFATVDLPGGPVLVGSLHNDSYDIRNNAAHVRQLLNFVGDRPCVLAGDFNSNPTQPPTLLLRDSGKFSGAFAGEATFPGHGEKIDYVLAPAAWEHLGTRVPAGDASDHRAVAARFRVR